MLKRLIYALFLALFVLFNGLLVQAVTIPWGGEQWTIRADNGGPYGPGPNLFDGTGVSVDKDGKLHLVIQQGAKGWVCPEIVSVKAFGFGTISGVINAVIVDGKQVPVTSLDKQSVLGIFGYPTPDLGPDGTNEYDIEFSYWGLDDKEAQRPQNFIQLSNYLTKLLPGKSSQMWRGADFNDTFNLSALNPLGFSIYHDNDSIEWQLWDVYTGAHMTHREQGLSRNQLVQAPMPFHFNLWLKDGKAPTAKTVEVVLSKFNFAPQR